MNVPLIAFELRAFVIAVAGRACIFDCIRAVLWKLKNWMGKDEKMEVNFSHSTSTAYRANAGKAQCNFSLLTSYDAYITALVFLKISISNMILFNRTELQHQNYNISSRCR